MRNVSGNVATARAHARSAAAPGTPRRGTAYCTTTLFFCSVGVVRIDDACDKGMAHDVLRAELRERNAAHAVEDASRFDQPALLPAREIDLRDVTVHYCLRAETDPGEEHLHLLGRRVLRFVEDDEGMVEGPAAHIGERRELDGSSL